jgi:hypothetical protein
MTPDDIKAAEQLFRDTNLNGVVALLKWLQADKASGNEVKGLTVGPVSLGFNPDKSALQELVEFSEALGRLPEVALRTFDEQCAVAVAMLTYDPKKNASVTDSLRFALVGFDLMLLTHPLPWHRNTDWGEEVIASDGVRVGTFRSVVEAKGYIAFAEARRAKLLKDATEAETLLEQQVGAPDSP